MDQYSVHKQFPNHLRLISRVFAMSSPEDGERLLNLYSNKQEIVHSSHFRCVLSTLIDNTLFCLTDFLDITLLTKRLTVHLPSSCGTSPVTVVSRTSSISHVYVRLKYVFGDTGVNYSKMEALYVGESYTIRFKGP